MSADVTLIVISASTSECKDIFTLNFPKDLISSTGCECVCIGNDENVKIFLTDGDCEANVLTVLGKLGIHRKVVEIEKIQRIPRNEFGKIMYSKLM